MRRCGVGLPQPVGAVLLEFAQQQADGLVALGERDLARRGSRPAPAAREAADHQQRGEQRDRGREPAIALAAATAWRRSRRRAMPRKASVASGKRRHRDGADASSAPTATIHRPSAAGIGVHGPNSERRRPTRPRASATPVEHGVAHVARASRSDACGGARPAGGTRPRPRPRRRARPSSPAASAAQRAASSERDQRRADQVGGEHEQRQLACRRCSCAARIGPQSVVSAGSYRPSSARASIRGCANWEAGLSAHGAVLKRAVGLADG